MLKVLTKDVLIKIIFALVSIVSTLSVNYLRNIDERQRQQSLQLAEIAQTLKIQENVPELVQENRRNIFKLESEVRAAERRLDKLEN